MSDEVKKDQEVKEETCCCEAEKKADDTEKEACCCEAEKKADDAEKKACCCEAEKKADDTEKKACCCGEKKSSCRIVILLIVLLVLLGVLAYKVQKYRYEQTYQKSVEDKIIAVIGSSLPENYKVSVKYDEKEALYRVAADGKTRKIEFGMICVYKFGPDKFGPEVRIAEEVDLRLWDRFQNAVSRESLAAPEADEVKAAVKTDVQKAAGDKVQQAKSDLADGAKKVEAKVQEQAKQADKTIKNNVIDNVQSDAQKAKDSIQKNVIDKIQVPAAK